jgi:hypothetical protein
MIKNGGAAEFSSDLEGVEHLGNGIAETTKPIDQDSGIMWWAANSPPKEG